MINAATKIKAENGFSELALNEDEKDALYSIVRLTLLLSPIA